MRYLVAGGSGFLGSHLIARLRDDGHEVTQLVRRAPRASDQVQWQPADGVLDPDVVAAADVVVNVAGSPTVGNPHSKRWARELRESRVDTTRLLADAIAEPPAGAPRSWPGTRSATTATTGPSRCPSRPTAAATRCWRRSRVSGRP